MTNDDNREFEKKLAIYQIAASAGATLGSIIVSMGISLMIFSTDLSFQAIGEDAAKNQLYKVMGGGFYYQGLAMFLAGLAILLGSLITISRTIKKL